MKKTTRQRVRGTLGMGLTWAAGWAPVGAVIGWVVGLLLEFPLGVVTANYALTFGALGCLGGAIFSAVLRLTEGGRDFHQLSLPRFAALGAVGGLVLGTLAVTAGLFGAGLTAVGAMLISVLTVLGAGSAAATLAVARRARGLPWPTKTELTEEEGRELLQSGPSLSFAPAAVEKETAS